jgi:transcriptional regulator with XRE-family HTH domain
MTIEQDEETNEEQNQVAARLRGVIGANIADLREEVSRRRVADGEKKFSQADLAEALTKSGYNVKAGQIGHMESARKFPSLPLLVALADYFGTSLDFITGRTKNRSSIAEIDEDLQTGGISGRLGEIYKSLPAERQEEVYKFALAQQLIVQAEDEEPDEETIRFVHAMLGSFEKRLGTKAIEATLEDLVREFPLLRPRLGGALQAFKKKRSQS